MHEICRRASLSPRPPYKALFAAYDDVFAEQQIGQEHDGVVFRWLLRVGETAPRSNGTADLTASLRVLLSAQGITLVENGEDEAETEAVARNGEMLAHPHSASKAVALTGRRRLSFDDARMDETWLSEHTRLIGHTPEVSLAQPALLAQPARRGRPAGVAGPGRRARSTSSHGAINLHRQPAPKHASPSTAPASEYSDYNSNPTLLFQLSQTQLEQNAEAFCSTSALRSARQALHTWHDATCHARDSRHQAYSLASAHDRRTLLKQALDEWRTTSSTRQGERRAEAHWERAEKNVERQRDHFNLRKAFTHWAVSSQDQILVTKVAHTHMLRFRYFRRWKQLTVSTSETVCKVQSLLTRRCLNAWREKVSRRQLQEEQAGAFYEETAVKRCWRSWFWHFCSRRVDGWHEQRVKGRALGSLHAALEERQHEHAQAHHHRSAHTAGDAIRAIGAALHERRDSQRVAEAHHSRTVTMTTLRTLVTLVTLQPISRTVQLRVSLNLQRKALRIWTLQFTLNRQAAEVDRRRILARAWSSWNDTLRTKALGQRIDERVLVESIYKWVLQERLRLFTRARDARLVSLLAGFWRDKVIGLRGALLEAEASFHRDQRRRRLATNMVKLHHAMRKREDAERAAVEMRNGRLLPTIFANLQQETTRKQGLDKWAQDARFYTLCSQAIHVWQRRTTQHQQGRKRDAYAQVRARVKVHMVGTCFARWHERCVVLQDLDTEAARRSQSRVHAAGTKAFDRWRAKTARLADFNLQAEALDRQKLLGSALTALIARTAELAQVETQALALKRETDLALVSSALKRLQWAQFTASRKDESADALWARNRDMHVRSMLRVWLTQASARRAHRTATDEEEPESPSLRPASRAQSRSSMRAPFFSPPPGQETTPAYLRTPSRSRKAGRFRPLPAPAPLTPFAFDQAYIVTTPAPLPVMPQANAPTDDFDTDILTPQVTPFARKLRAGGIASTPAPALRSAVFGGSVQAGSGTAKSVRFAASGRGRSRFGAGTHLKGS